MCILMSFTRKRINKRINPLLQSPRRDKLSVFEGLMGLWYDRAAIRVKNWSVERQKMHDADAGLSVVDAWSRQCV